MDVRWLYSIFTMTSLSGFRVITMQATHRTSTQNTHLTPLLCVLHFSLLRKDRACPYTTAGFKGGDVSYLGARANF